MSNFLLLAVGVILAVIAVWSAISYIKDKAGKRGRF